MRLSTVLKVAVVGGFGIAVLAIAAAKSLDLGRIKTLLVAEVKAATGRDLTINGGLRLRGGLVPALVADGVSLANRPGGSRPDMLRVDRVEAELALLPLLRGDVRVVRVVVSGPDIVLETGADGIGNWVPNPAPAAAGKSDKATARFNLREFKIKNARVTLVGADRSGDTYNVHRFSIQPERPGAGPVSVHVVADHSGKTFELTGRLGSLASLGDGKPWPIRLKASGRGIQAALDGTLTAPLAGKGADLKVGLQADEFADLARLAGRSLPPVGPFRLSARLTDAGGLLGLADIDAALGRRDMVFLSAKGAVRDLWSAHGIELAVATESDNLAGLSRLVGFDVPSMGPARASAQLRGGVGDWRLSDFKAAVAASELVGEVAWSGGRVPKVSAQLSATALALADFTTPAVRPGEKLEARGAVKGANGRLVPDWRVPVDLLRSVDADIALHVGTLALGSVRLTDTAVGLRLGGGRLELAPMRAGLAGGALDGSVDLRTNGAVPSVAVSLRGMHVEWGRLGHELGLTGSQAARGDFTLALAGRGDDLRAMLAAAEGGLVADVGPGFLPGGDEMRCAVARATVKDGMFQTERGLAVETASHALLGGGTLDLAHETVELTLLPQNRGGRGLILSGPLAEPTLSWRETAPIEADGSVCQMGRGQVKPAKPRSAKPSR
ncbi:MAG: AsmA family protein [Alphaproteobacteria bacterium]|nr:AsmA family protein [Alphaproteobacteria bacterium]